MTTETSLGEKIRQSEWNHGKYGFMGGLTSRCGYTTTQRYNGSDVFSKKLVHLLDELPSNARVTADERVHPDQDCTSNPGLGHCSTHRVKEGQNVKLLNRRRKHTEVLHLKKCIPESKRVICPSVGTSTKPSGDAVHADTIGHLVRDNVTALLQPYAGGRRVVENHWGIVARRCGDSRDRKSMPIDNNGFAIPEECQRLNSMVDEVTKPTCSSRYP